MYRPFLFYLPLVLLLGYAAAGLAQQPPAETAPDEAAPDDEPAEQDDQPEGEPSAGFLPSVDVYFPEGDLDFRLNRLIKNAFFEGQLRYNFVEGDISAFLRYRYYGYARTYLISLFDEVEFEEIEDFDNDFERVRGGLFLVEWPHNYHKRSFFLAEVDHLTSNKEEFQFSTNRTNTFIRVGHQVGTPDDVRSNAIVGETRAAVQRLFTAHRKIGPQGAGVTGALTYATELLGDFDYLRGEFEALKRFDFPNRTFLVARLHGGTFFDKKPIRDDPELEPFTRFDIPTTEFFRLDGRENLKGIDEALRGTEELHTTFEYFFPWFLKQDRRALGLDWTNWYWVLYGGAGTIGFDPDVFTDLGSYVTDIGFGFESSFRFKNYSFFLAGIVAHALSEEGDLKARLAIKSYH